MYEEVKKVINLVVSAFAVAAFGVMLLWFVAYCYYGDVSSGTKRLRGYTIFVENVKIEAGSLDRDSGLVHFPLKVKNITSNPVRIVGLSAGCNCVHFEGVPLTLKAYETTELNGTLHWKEELQNGFRYEVLMLFDTGTAPVVFVIEG